MNTKLLKCFQIVYEEKSINRAAGRLYITPQGLSRNIRQLEEELDAQLFRRTARGFVPDIAAKTADGAGLYRLCSQKVGLAVVPEFFRDEFRMEGVRAIPFEEHFLWEVYGVCRRETAGYENIRLFDRYLKEQAGL